LNEALFAAYVSLFIFTAGIMFLYYRRTKEASREYVRARTALDDMILSFNKDLRTQEEKIRETADKSEQATSENRRIVEGIKSDIAGIEAQLMNLVNTRESLVGNYDALRKNVDDLMSQRIEILERVGELESLKRVVEIPSTTMDLAIPIRREEALAPLTETELTILNLLANEGDRTAPQIKQRIGLTREHTARLMKNLFSRGYVERRTDRMPYVYRLKKEMGELLGNQRTET
jgi:predicted HTH transcriptional regulator